MQQAVPYRDYLSANAPAGQPSAAVLGEDGGAVASLIKESAVVVFARRGCCMCHVVKLLLQGHGVSPVIFDVDEENEGEVRGGLEEAIGGGDAAEMDFPAVFVGGEWFGGLDEVMSAHISGELVPKLIEARALWL